MLATQLSIADFGLFATASAMGVVLSRIAGFGFVSPLYRIATVKQRLIGVYTAGLLAALLASLPFVVVAAYSAWAVFFSGQMALAVFAMIVAAEALCWRPLEVVIIVNKGLYRFGRATMTIAIGAGAKALAALALAFSGAHDLASWAQFYLGCLALAFVASAVLFYPRRRLRFDTRIFGRRMADSLSVMGAEILFYIQMELDKLVVLMVGGAQAAGIYAIIMRLVDLTAIPIRTLSTLLTQRLMRDPGMIDRVKIRALLEGVVFAVSTAGIAFIGGLLWLKPTLLGANVAAAAPLVITVLLVPAFRNAIEYQAELLYGRGQTALRVLNYALLGGLKAVLLVWLLTSFTETADWVWRTNLVFAALYVASFALTYSALRRPAVRV